QQALFFNQLKSVLAGTISFIELSSHWEKHDRSELLDWQLHWLQQLIKYEAGDRQANEALELLSYLQSKSCWVIYDRLLELKALSTHPLNGRLFIENMLSSWL
ncbi:MAG TPA: DNA polymerase III subunit delta' C-terminal domain-containing protein, partial [Thiolinea sp.]|nr:DNA polymerase III subunit delta' C-terminal domain-containing protein [Thiolinea sp.]